MQQILHNRIKCLHCGDIIESKTRWDMVWCSCKTCAVDGGKDYLRRVGSMEDWEDLSEVKHTEEKHTEDTTKPVTDSFFTGVDVATLLRVRAFLKEEKAKDYERFCHGGKSVADEDVWDYIISLFERTIDKLPRD